MSSNTKMTVNEFFLRLSWFNLRYFALTYCGLDRPGTEPRWGGGEIFSAHLVRPRDLPSLLCSWCLTIPGGKVAGEWR